MKQDIYPVITLYQPWATWIMRGWKTIETRTHSRFACLHDKTILIHAGLKTDRNAIENYYLTREQLLYKPEDMINGYILGSAYVSDCKYHLDNEDSLYALIECNTQRFGLFLENVKVFEKPIQVQGSMGIWYYDLESMKKISKYERST